MLFVFLINCPIYSLFLFLLFSCFFWVEYLFMILFISTNGWLSTYICLFFRDCSIVYNTPLCYHNQDSKKKKYLQYSSYHYSGILVFLLSSLVLSHIFTFTCVKKTHNILFCFLQLSFERFF